MLMTTTDIPYVVNDEDLWNQEDYVGVIIPEDKISYRIIEDKEDEE